MSWFNTVIQKFKEALALSLGSFFNTWFNTVSAGRKNCLHRFEDRDGRMHLSCVHCIITPLLSQSHPPAVKVWLYNGCLIFKCSANYSGFTHSLTYYTYTFRARLVVGYRKVIHISKSLLNNNIFLNWSSGGIWLLLSHDVGKRERSTLPVFYCLALT